MSKTTSPKSASSKSSSSPKAAKAGRKPAAKKAAGKPGKTEAKTPAPSKPRPKEALRGQVEMTITKALEFIGGNPETVLSFSRKSLVEAETANDRAKSAARLANFDDNSDL